MIERLLDHVWIPDPKDLANELEWIKDEVEDVGAEKIHKLSKSASKVRKNAYTPITGYDVGSSLLTESGNEYSSCNVEDDTLTLTGHAELGTIQQAITDGEIERSGEKFIRVVVVSHSKESGPCGHCRQRIAQHADNAVIVDVDENGEIQGITSLKILLQYSFSL